MLISKKVPYIGILLAFALVLSYIEFIIPINIGIPGVKLGLANFIIIICLYNFEIRDVFLLTILRVLLSSILFGNMTSFWYSLAGGIISAIIMIVLKQLSFGHIPVISAVGGVAHNLGQLCVAFFIFKTKGVFYHMPILIIAGCLSGLSIGILAATVQPYIRRIVKENL